jgi:uncharacterized protein with beta-barrel porin domain
MRILIALPLLALGACQVSKDEANNTVSVTFNQEVASNAMEDAQNVGENVAAGVGNEVKRVGDRIDNTDVDVKVDTNVQTENKSR